MDKHTLALNKICRLCGNKISGNQKHYNKQQFYAEFGTLYGIQLDLESDNVHPRYICAKDAAVMYRTRTAIKEGKDFCTHLVPFLFSEHSDDCYVSDTVYKEIKSAGRPKKPKLFQTGGIHLQNPESTNPLSDTVDESIDTAGNTYDCNHDNPTPKCFICVSIMMRNVLNECRREEEKIQIFSCLLEKLENTDITLLAYVLGKSQTSNIRKDARKFGLFYKDANALSRLKLEDWISDRNEVLRQFMCGVGGIEQTNEETRNDKMIGLTTAIEQVYSLCDERLICPFAFLQSLCIYSLTGSRKTVDLNGKVKPSGCYSSIVNWLLEQNAREPNVADGDLINVFDNEQVIGFKSAIKPKHKAKVSIITNKGYLIFDGSGDLQKEQSLKPPQILKLESLDQGTASRTKAEFEEAVKGMIDGESEIRVYERHKYVHYEQLYYFVENAIKVVAAEQHKNGTCVSDSVDQTVQDTRTEELFLTCCSCGTKNVRRKIVCTGCNSKEGIKMARNNAKDTNSNTETPKQTSFCKIQFETKEDDSVDITTTYGVETSERYDHVNSNHLGKKELVITDPVFCNPNSFESVALVLRQIGIENGITRYGGSRRHWTFICCDGIPYLICKKLKEEAVICAIDDCSDSFLSKKEYHIHVQNAHSDAPECKYVYEFDWFYLRIGAGHYEMNLVKSFFELNWVPFIETLCEEMGFSSDAAKLFAKNCKDHHKSWYLLVIFHLAVLRELAVPYVRDCMGKQINEMTAKGFFKFWNEMYQDTPTLQYLMDQVCRMSQGIINFRMAIRRNNADLMHSAKFMTKELFHIRHHPKYQDIESYDHLQYLLMPANVQSLSDRNISVTTSGNSSSGEDLDFILEEKNRQLKQ